MASTIKIKNSSTAGAAPSASDLVQGELAVNVTDKRIYTENASGTVVELGTNPSVPVTFPDGSASAPSLTNDGDTNTGVFFPAADTVAIATGGTERVRVDSSGNVGIGTSSPAAPLHVYSSAQEQLRLSRSTTGSSGYLTFYANNASAAQVQYAGILGDVASSTAGSHGGNLLFYTTGSGTSTERMRIDSSGNLLVGTTSTSFSSSAGYKINASTAGQQQMCITVDTATGGHGTYHVYNMNATNNGFRFYVATNGGIYNYSGNNSNLSDERTKKNIEVSGGYLDKICAIPVKLFNYKDEAEGEQRTLGLIAQDVEAVAPELVNLEGFGETPEDGVPLKSIYTTDMMFALMKCIQEQQAIITQLQADVAALKGQ